MLVVGGDFRADETSRRGLQRSQLLVKLELLRGVSDLQQRDRGALAWLRGPQLGMVPYQVDKCINP